MATQYSFITHWKIKAPVEKVWEAIYHSLDWPDWWKGVVRVVELEHGDENGIDGMRSYTWKSKLPYQLTFTMCNTNRQCFFLIRRKNFTFT